MKAQAIALVLLAIFGTSVQLYGAGSKVVHLTAANFREKVVNSNGIWLVEFYGKI